MTYALRVTWSLALDALAAPITRKIAQIALTALGLSGDPFHDPFHARGLASHRPCSPCVTSLHSLQDSRHAVDARPVMPTADLPVAARHANSG